MTSLTVSLSDQEPERTRSMGIAHYSLNLTRELAASAALSRLTILGNGAIADRLSGLPAAIVRCDAPLRGRIRRLCWDQLGVYRAAARTGCDWLLLPKGYASWAVKCPVRLAVVVHDVMCEHYRRCHPETSLRMQWPYFRKCLLATLRRAELIFTDTRFVAGQLLELAAEHGIEPPPVEAVGIGFSREDVQFAGRWKDSGSAGQRRGISVLVSRWPHKRSDLAISYLSRWQEKTRFREPVHLVGSLPAGLKAAHANWCFHERLPAAAYARLTGNTRALVYFTEYEGFGMPPVEAVLLGLCPVYSSTKATAEVMNRRGHAFDNHDPGSFFTALDNALDESRSTIDAWGREIEETRSWKPVVSRLTERMSPAGGHEERKGR